MHPNPKKNCWQKPYTKHQHPCCWIIRTRPNFQNKKTWTKVALFWTHFDLLVLWQIMAIRNCVQWEAFQWWAAGAATQKAINHRLCWCYPSTPIRICAIPASFFQPDAIPASSLLALSQHLFRMLSQHPSSNVMLSQHLLCYNLHVCERFVSTVFHHDRAGHLQLPSLLLWGRQQGA